MLQKLIIRNYAIIDHLTIEPHTELNTVTGETGAGKSIILGALSLILGERADLSVLINKDEKCVVEAFFDVADNKAFQTAVRTEELDEEKQCIIRREITPSGKSRAFVNDTPVTLAVLNKLTSLLVDLHQQFGHLAFSDDQFQMEVIDAIAKNNDLNKAYREIYLQYRKITSTLSELKAQQAQWQKEADYKQFLYDELAQLSFKENEIEAAAQQLKQLSHSERIISTLQTSRLVLDEGEQPLINELKRTMQQLQQISDVLPALQPLQERLSSVHSELKDIVAELETLEGKLSLDPELMTQLQDRVDAGYKLLKKHALNDTAGLLALQDELSMQLQATHDLDEKISKLTAEQETGYKALVSAAEKLSVQRKKAAPTITDKVNALLKLVGMPNAQFRVDISTMDTPGQNGQDEVQFLLDANKSGQFLPVYKAASGGEMSRIMLCIKSLTARAMHLPTLIFDEVDTGISGEAARQVGLLLKDLSRYHQVICITHQPQVAAKGSAHFFVYKDQDSKGRITTRLRILRPEERVMAIAQMIGGVSPSEAALQNAKELVMN